MNTWNPFDPWNTFRQMRDAYLESAARRAADLVNTEDYARATGALLEAYLNTAWPWCVWMEKLMPQMLAYYGMPSRQQIVSLAERMTNVEMRLDDMEAILADIRRLLHGGTELERRAA